MADSDCRLARGLGQFRELYGRAAEIRVRSPGRVEVIGNHTDYNQGYAIAAPISRSILAFVAPRRDRTVRVFSNSYPDSSPAAFELEAPIPRDELAPWTNYVRGVAQELLARGQRLSGADILLDSDIPASGGFSTSAALELAVAFGLLGAAGTEPDRMQLAMTCQKAENEYVRSPCGFLDQGSIALAADEALVFMDFLPSEGKAISDFESIPVNLAALGASIVVGVDPRIKRQLGASGYPARRRMCAESLPVLSRLLRREISSLRYVTTEDLFSVGPELAAHDAIMAKRVEHIVHENRRVLAAREALKAGDLARFGNLLSASGWSALNLYELDEKTPELRFLYEAGRTLPGIYGIRNMGGGFSAVILALVGNDCLLDFGQRLNELYRRRFSADLQIFELRTSAGVGFV